MPRPSPDDLLNSLALELEIEILVMRDTAAFRRRLQRALADAYARGAGTNKAIS